MSTQGHLQDMPVADLIQQYCQNKKTARLILISNGHQAALFFKNGNVIHAQLDDVVGEEVIYAVLEWDVGEFQVDSGVEATTRSVTRSWSGLLLEGARRIDEADMEKSQSKQSTPQEVKTMELDNILKEMSEQVEGFMAASIVGMDGIGIAEYAKSKKVNPEAINAQMALLNKLVMTTADKVNAGSVEDELLTTENAYVLIRMLRDRNYFLGLAADRKSAQLGNMRLISRLFADRASKALPH